jgi:uncharacterized protein YegP (UPF0339 family)
MAGQAKFQVFPDVDGEHRWRLRAANGEIVAQSEGYTSQEGAERGVDAVAQAVGQVEWRPPLGERVAVEVVDE